MTSLETLLRQVSAWFDKGDRPWALVGGLAVSVRTEPRFTRDDRTRPQDAADLQQLMAASQPSDLDAACAAVRLIEARGYNRSRNLVEALMSAWREFRP